jgi:hypothetical protein
LGHFFNGRLRNGTAAVEIGTPNHSDVEPVSVDSNHLEDATAARRVAAGKFDSVDWGEFIGANHAAHL